MQFPADANDFDGIDCQTALKSLKSISSVQCERESANEMTGTGSYIITALGYPLLPQENNFIYHNGNPPLDYFRCNMSSIDLEEATTPYCEVEDINTNDLPGTLI